MRSAVVRSVSARCSGWASASTAAWNAAISRWASAACDGRDLGALAAAAAAAAAWSAASAAARCSDETNEPATAADHEGHPGTERHLRCAGRDLCPRGLRHDLLSEEQRGADQAAAQPPARRALEWNEVAERPRRGRRARSGPARRARGSRRRPRRTRRPRSIGADRDRRPAHGARDREVADGEPDDQRDRQAAARRRGRCRGRGPRRPPGPRRRRRPASGARRAAARAAPSSTCLPFTHRSPGLGSIH